MLIYTAKRVISLAPALVVVAIVTFALIHLTPGGPAAVLLGPEATVDEIAALEHELGYDRALPVQFTDWVAHAIQGDLGESISMSAPVVTTFFAHLMPTLSLAVIALLLSVAMAIPLGVLAAHRRGTIIDQTMMTVAIVGISVPSFLLALLLMLSFGLGLGWLPVTGYVPPSRDIGDFFLHLVLPAVSLAVINTALIARMTRSSMLDVLSMSYVKTARSKGLSERRVVYFHALRNAFLPILTVIGETFGDLIAGALIIETVFSIPGLGFLTLRSISSRDYPMLQGLILIVACMYIIINLIVDLLYAALDPRVRFE